ncbi:hypothetical protein NOR53_2461 [gamma proteobacterium NOR5-3]|nr:hypothetical protein NOR53_2461 [gamma proteobacterium NOR5-3]
MHLCWYADSFAQCEEQSRFRVALPEPQSNRVGRLGQVASCREPKLDVVSDIIVQSAEFLFCSGGVTNDSSCGALN